MRVKDLRVKGLGLKSVEGLRLYGFGVTGFRVPGDWLWDLGCRLGGDEDSKGWLKGSRVGFGVFGCRF